MDKKEGKIRSGRSWSRQAPFDGAQGRPEHPHEVMACL